jgi:hypothetical protein
MGDNHSIQIAIGRENCIKARINTAFILVPLNLFLIKQKARYE